MKITWKMVGAAVVICLLVGVAYGDEIAEALGLGPADDDVVVGEESLFKFSAVKKEVTGTAVTGATSSVLPPSPSHSEAAGSGST